MSAKAQKKRKERVKKRRLPRVAAAIANWTTVIGEILGVVMQLLLVLLGWNLAMSESKVELSIVAVVWCLIAALYLGIVALGLTIMIRISDEDPPVVRRVVGHPVMRVFSNITTFGASAFGLLVAAQVIINRRDADRTAFLEAAAVCAMLLSWALFNWGFARVYYSRYHRAEVPPLHFPRTEDPRLSDFAYFSFTNATTFAVSDVRVTETRMRWTTVWHTSMAFFFNALILALTMSTITSGRFLDFDLDKFLDELINLAG